MKRTVTQMALERETVENARISTEATVSAEEADKLCRNKKKYKRKHDGESDGENEDMDLGEDGGKGKNELPNTTKVSLDKSTTGKLSFKSVLVEERDDWYVGSDDEDDPDMVDVTLESENEQRAKHPTIFIPVEELRKVRRPWRKAVIIKLLGRSLGFRLLEERVRNIWKLSGRFEMVGLGDGYYLVRFTLKQDYQHVLLDGPWVILGHYLTVSKWKPSFKPNISELPTTMVWVRFPGLPIEFFDGDILMRMGDLVGKAIKLDRTSEMKSRGEYARVCVEIELSKSLVAKVGINEQIYNVEYEGLHLICFHCGLYGHKKETCPSIWKEKERVDLEAEQLDRKEEGEIKENSSGNKPDESNEGLYGEWMVVKNSNRRGLNMRWTNSNTGRPGFNGRRVEYGENQGNKGLKKSVANSEKITSKQDGKGSRFEVLRDISNTEKVEVNQMGPSEYNMWENATLRFVAKDDLKAGSSGKNQRGFLHNNKSDKGKKSLKPVGKVQPKSGINENNSDCRSQGFVINPNFNLGKFQIRPSNTVENMNNKGSDVNDGSRVKFSQNDGVHNKNSNMAFVKKPPDRIISQTEGNIDDVDMGPCPILNEEEKEDEGMWFKTSVTNQDGCSHSSPDGTRDVCK